MKILVGVAVGVVLACLAAGSGADLVAQTIGAPASPVEYDILGATVQVALITLAPDAQQVVETRGLGTVVASSGRCLLVTHDHWGALLEAAGSVEILDADGEILLELSGAEFRSLILYRDGGTMVLSAPSELLAGSQPPMHSAELAADEQLAPGDTVQIVHQVAGKPHQLSVMDAVVESVGGKDQRPVYVLTSTDGQPIVPGDSGGGVWREGELLGNMWTTVMIRQVSIGSGKVTEVMTDTCVAAIHLETVRSLCREAEEPTETDDILRGQVRPE